MKTLKLNHAAAKRIASGKQRSTWRIYDDKNISVGDEIELIDKVDSIRPDTWQAIGVASVDWVTEKRLKEVSDGDFGDDESSVSRDEMTSHYQGYYGETLTEHTPVKIIHFEFTAHNTPHTIPKPDIEYRHIKLFADGGSRGNPGPSASGYVLLDPKDNILKKSGVYLGITTNNQAEYQAVKFGLEEAKKLGAQEVEIYLDSLLVVNQMKGIFKVKNRDLWPIHEALRELTHTFKKVTFTHVPREFNRLADAEVNETLDAEADK